MRQKTPIKNVETLLFHEERSPEDHFSRLRTLFGSHKILHECLLAAGYDVCLSTVYRWGWSRDRGGCGGRIPTRAWPWILRAARFAGVLLKMEDLLPFDLVPTIPQGVRTQTKSVNIMRDLKNKRLKEERLSLQRKKKKDGNS